MKKILSVLVCVGGFLMAGCENASQEIVPSPAMATDPPVAAHPVKQSYTLDVAQSVVEWKGAGPAAAHAGSFAVTSQEIEVLNGKIKSGTFVIPISSIQNFDLPEEVKPILLEHLKSPDFFNLLLYPEATFRIRRVMPLNQGKVGAAGKENYQVTGYFTMIGQTHELSFPAHIAVDGSRLVVAAKLTIDRTKWGMHYAADPALGEHHIYPEVALHLKLTGTRM